MTKKLVSLVLSISLAMSYLPIFAVQASAAYSGGDGTESNPYQISTVAELKELRDKVNAGTTYDGVHFKLANSLDLTGESWTPIGIFDENDNENDKGHPFKGTFDGNYKIIKGLNVNSQANAGLFGYIYDADISSLAVKGTIQGNQNAGGIAGYCRNSRITYCANYCTITGNDDNTGGIAGYLHKWDDDITASVTCCYNKGVIIGAGDTGGIVGESLNGGIIENCYNVGTVTGTYMNTGGVIGFEDGRSDVQKCYNYASIKGASNTGEIIGCRSYDSSSDVCYYLLGGSLEPIGSYFGQARRMWDHTAEEFADKDNIEDNFVLWDFENVWIMSEAHKRPILRLFPEDYLTVHYILQKNDGTWENIDTAAEYYETAVIFTADKAFENHTLTAYSTGEYKAAEAEREVTYPGSNITLNTEITDLYLYYTLDTQKLIFYADSEGTEIDSTENVILGAPLAQYADKTLAEKQGYTFAGWSYEKNQNYYKTKSGEVNSNFIDWTNLTMPGGTFEVYPIWVRDRLNVKLALDDDAVMDADQSRDFTVDIDEKLRMSKMNTATREGYTLDGWYTEDGVKWNADYGVTPEYCDKSTLGTPIIQTEDNRKYNYYTVTLTSKWTPKTVTIKYDKGDQGTAETADDYVDFGGEVTLAAAPAHNDAYNFTGWKDKNNNSYSANGVFEFTDWSLAEDDIITLTAVYKEKEQNSIIFDTDGGTPIEPVTGYVDTTVNLEDKTTSKTGHTFDVWLDDSGTPITQVTIGNDPKTVKARWKVNKYTITFDTNGGTEITPITQDYGTTITPPADPTKEHYDFTGWDTDIPDKMPARDMTISARWTPKEYTITFNTDGGSAISPIKGVYGSKVVAPPNPIKNGYTFFGWDTEIPAYMPDTNPIITAKWKENQEVDPPEIVEITPTTISIKQRGNEEYRIDGGEWKHSDNGEPVVFDGLRPNSTHEFTAIKPGDETHMPSDVSEPTSGTTPKLPQDPPDPPDVSAQSATTIVVNPTYKGLEYRIEKGEWISDWVTPNAQGTVIFGGLTAITEYDVRARKSETETQYASDPSLPSRVTTMSDAPVDIYYVKQQSDGTWENADIEDETPRDLKSYTADKTFDHYTLTGYSIDEYKDEAQRTAASNGDTITFDAEISSLYLYYALDKHDLVFYRDIEGTVEEKTESEFYGAPLEKYSTTTPAPKEGYTFAAWSPVTDQDWYRQKNGTQNENVISWYGLTMPADGYNAYPIWVRDRLNVHLNLDDDATMDESQSTEFTVDIDEKLRMEAMNAATREGYTLDGWYTQDGVKWNADMGITPEYCDKDENNNAIITTNELRKYNTYSVTLTPKWNTIKVGVNYVLGEGTGDITDSNTYGLGDTINIKNAPTAPGGKSFIGWKDKNGTTHSANGTLEFNDWSITEKDTTTLVDKITLTAVYKEIPQNSIIFDTQGGTAVDPVTDYVDTTVNLADKTTSKTGYTFVGWYDGDTKVTEVTIGTTQKTVTAHWTANQYTITFDTNGADSPAIEPITLEYGEPVTAPQNPTKNHYDFAGWDTEIPETMPARDMTISAIWMTKLYKIFFDTDGGSEIAPIEDIYGSKVQAPQNPTKNGYTFAGWNPEIPAYMPDTNPTITAKWKENQAPPDPPIIYDRTTTSISVVQRPGEEYRIDGGEWKKSSGEYVVFGGLIPDTEHEFTARKTGDETHMPSGVSGPTIGRTLPYTTIDIYYIKQQTDGTWANENTTDKALREMHSYKADKTFDHYTLTGYSIDEYKDEAERTAASNGDTISYGNEINSLYLYYALEKHDLIFYRDIEGTEKEKTESVFYGSPLFAYSTTTPDPKQGYTFAAWSYEKGQDWYRQKDGTQNDKVISWYTLTMPAEDFSAYPIWVRDRLEVHLNIDDDATMDETQSTEFTVDIDEKLRMEKMNEATREGYTLDGWYTQDGVEWNADYGVTPEYCDKDADNNPIITTNEQRKYNSYSVTLTPKWTPIKVGVNYVLGEGTGDIADNETYGLGDTITVKSEPTPPTGKTFIGWRDKTSTIHSANGAFEFNDWNVTENNIITLTAVYKEIPQNSIIFDTQGGTAVEPVTDRVSTAVDLTGKKTTKTGHTFEGWYYNNAKVTTINIGDTPKTVVANWTKNQYTITFDTNGADPIDPITLDYGANVSAPADPQKAHYTFAGWDIEIPATMPARNMTISALWTPNEYTIYFNTDGGTAIDPITGIYGSKVEKPQDPTKEGYDFDGWDQEIPTYMPDNNPTITAKWKEKEAGTTPTPTPTTKPRSGGGGSSKSKATPTPTPSATPTPTSTTDPMVTPIPSASPKAIPSHLGKPKFIDKDPFVAGYEDGSFRPDNYLTRAELATMLARLMTNKFDGYSSTFSDTKGIWSEKYIGYLESQDIIGGYEDGTYRPENSVTRAEMAVMIAKVYEYDLTEPISSADTGFSDIDDSYTKWGAASAIKQLAEDGVLSGYEDGTFHPGNAIERDETVAIINRTIFNMEIEEITATPNDVTDSHWAYNDIIFAMNKRKNK